MKNCLSMLLLLAPFMPASVMAGEEPNTPANVVSAFHEALASGELNGCRKYISEKQLVHWDPCGVWRLFRRPVPGPSALAMASRITSRFKSPATPV